MKSLFLNPRLNWILPLAAVLAMFAAYYAGIEDYQKLNHNPLGTLELGTGLVLLIVCAFGVVAVRVADTALLKRWLLAYTLAVFFFVGEDNSWGQYLFQWNVPEYFLENNKEQETNLHNMSSWFNQKPRLIVELWLWIACILVPLGWQVPKRLTRRFVPEILWPDKRMLLVSLAAAMASWPERINKSLMTIDVAWMRIRPSEIQELLFAYVMLVYILLVLERIRAGK